MLWKLELRLRMRDGTGTASIGDCTISDSLSHHRWTRLYHRWGRPNGIITSGCGRGDIRGSVNITITVLHPGRRDRVIIRCNGLFSEAARPLLIRRTLHCGIEYRQTPHLLVVKKKSCPPEPSELSNDSIPQRCYALTNHLQIVLRLKYSSQIVIKIKTSPYHIHPSSTTSSTSQQHAPDTPAHPSPYFLLNPALISHHLDPSS